MVETISKKKKSGRIVPSEIWIRVQADGHLSQLTIADASPAFEAMIGETIDVLKGKHLFDDIDLFGSDNKLVQNALSGIASGNPDGNHLLYSSRLRKWLGLQIIRISSHRYTIYFFDYTASIGQQANSPMGLFDQLEKKKWYEYKLKSSRDIYYTYSTKKGTIFNNHLSNSFFGYEQSEVKADPFLWEKVIHPEDMLVIKKILSEIQNNDFRELEYRIKDKKGNYLWILDKFFVEKISPDEIILDGYATDITERKALMLKLQENESLFRSFVDLSLDAISITNEKGKVIEWNHSLAEATGISTKSAIGKYIWDLQFEVAPECQKTKENHQALKQMIVSMLHTGNSPSLKKLLHHELVVKGERRILQNLTFPIKTNRGFKLASISRDVTELALAKENLEKSQLKYQLIADNIEETLFVLNKDLIPEYISPSSFNLTGFSAKELVNSEPDQLFEESDLSGVKKIIERSIKKAEFNTPIKLELQLKKKNRSIIWVEINIQIVPSTQQRVILIGTIRNIQDRKTVELKLAESENRLRMIVDYSEDMIQLQDPEGHYLYYKGPELGRGALTQVIGKKPEELFSAETAKEIYQEIAEVISTKKSIKNQQAIALNGKTTWFDNIRYPILKNSEVVAVGTISRNITKLKNFEFALMESEQKYYSIYNNAPIGIYRSTLEGKFLEMNDALARMLGYESPLEAIQSVGNISEEIYTDRALREQIVNKISDYQGMEIFEHMFKKRNGEFWYGQSYLTATRDETGNKILEGVLLDVTERKAAEIALLENEERFRKMFEDDLSPKLLLSPETGQIEEANQAAILFYGYTMEEIRQLTIFSINILPEAEVRKLMDKALKNEKNYFTFKHRIKDGSIRDVEVFSTMVQLKNKTQLLSTIHDVTARLQAETKLRESKKRLDELNATKDKFFNIIAHDLKTPINQMLSLTQLLEQYYQDQKYEEMIDLVRYLGKAAGNGANLVSNLLEWSRTQTGKIPVEIKKNCLCKIVEETINLLQPAADEKMISLSHSCHVKCSAYFDKNMIKTVLRNLVSNAIKFSYKNSSIRIQVFHQGSELVVEVADQGTGIRKVDLDKIFRIDQHFTTSGTAKETGTGLGLILCKEFIEKNTGKIWAESKYGKGSVFRFSLPVNKVQ